MKVNFPCPGCGKRLKATPDSVGLTRKCPVCATRVTCRAPALAGRAAASPLIDAEILEAEVMPAIPKRAAAPAARTAAPARRDPSPPASRPPADPFDDLGDDPYQLADPVEPEDPADEPKKPCPMCGETILAAAAKCRFCGEIFDKQLRKGQSKKRRKSSGGATSSTGLRDVGIGVACMVIGIGLTIAGYAAASGTEKGGRFMVFYGLVIGGFIQMCRGIGGMARGD